MSMLLDAALLSTDNAKKATLFYSLVQELSRSLEHPDVLVLDRAQQLALKAEQIVNFPAYSSTRCTADDSILIQHVCDRFKAERFLSARPTPTSTPMTLIVSQQNLLSSLSLQGREKHEWQLALSYCDTIFVENKMTAAKFLTLYPAYGHKLVQNIATSSATSSRRPKAFYKKWKELRIMQSKVDLDIWG